MFYDLKDPEMIEKILPEKAYRMGKAMKENKIPNEDMKGKLEAEEIEKGRRKRKWGGGGNKRY